MLITGKHNSAKIFTEVIEETAKEQIKALCDNAAFEKSKIRIMPDVHAGAGCTIGTTMTISDKVVPNMVGVDIGCGIELVRLNEKNIDFEKLDKLIYERIPSGMERRSTAHSMGKEIDLGALKCSASVDTKLGYRSIGTLGGGNHFIEVDEDDGGNLYLAVHSGSRHLGLEVAEFYQKQAYDSRRRAENERIKAEIEKMKSSGKARNIAEEYEKLRRKSEINPDTAYADGELFKDYIHDMKIVQQFAALNRRAIVAEITEGMGFGVADAFTTVHNYIDTDKMILRKGAVSAQKKQRLLIPINMRDGSLVCEGKGNPDWNFSAPHGAGRLLSRKKATETLKLAEYKKQMEGIYTTSVCKGTLDESPMAYKKIEDIINNIQPTVTVLKRIRPVYNFKASK